MRLTELVEALGTPISAAELAAELMEASATSTTAAQLMEASVTADDLLGPPSEDW